MSVLAVAITERWLIMSKFAYCYPADGMMWCVYPNGKHAHPFPLRGEGEKENRPQSNDEDDFQENNEA